MRVGIGRIMEARRRRPATGDRVRVRLPAGRGCREIRHFPEEDGQTGSILHDRATVAGPSHPYFVLFDRTVHVEARSGAIPLRAHHYALDELEPLGA